MELVNWIGERILSRVTADRGWHVIDIIGSGSPSAATGAVQYLSSGFDRSAIAAPAASGARSSQAYYDAR